MSRTTALKRLGVAALASVTVFGVAPAFTAPAAANHTVTGISLSPDADSAPTGTCNQFTATVTLSNGADTATVDVLADPRTTEDVEFCTLSDDGRTSTPASVPAIGGDAGATEHAEFDVTEPAGSTTKTVTFGIISNQPGVIDVTAFVEGGTGTTGTSNNEPNGNEPRDTSVKTFTQGGSEAVTTVDAEPETGSQVQGQGYTFTAKLTDVQGNPVPGVTPQADVISGPDANLTPICGASDQTGVADCTLVGGGQTPGADTIRVFVDKANPDNNPATADARTGQYDNGEPFDDITVTFAAPQAAGTTVEVTCTSVRTTTAGDRCQNPTSETSEVFTATVRNSAGTALSGVPVNFAMAKSTTAGEFDDAGTTASPDNEDIAPKTCTTGADGSCTTTLTNPRASQNETFTVTGTVQVSSGSGTGGGNTVSDSATKVFRDPAANEARNISLTPETQNSNVPGVAPIVATVTDRLGNPVQNVQVTFTEDGTGRFVNGSSTFTAVTNAQGRATAELQTVAGDAAGTNTVTGTITGFRDATTGNITERTSTGTNDECEQAAGSTTNAGGNAPGQTAGNCADTATVVFGGTSPSPSATPTGTATPSPVDCSVTPTVTLEFGTINATGSSGVTVNAPANSEIQLLAYSQPNTTYRVVREATINNDGDPAQFRIVPPTNTRLYAQIKGCTTDSTRFSKVLNVRTTLSLNVTRTGTRAYRFFGDSLPARPGGLIVSLYRVTNDGRQILTAQTRANAQNGDWVINRVFTGTGRFGFVVRTGQDLQNAPGASNVRSLLIF